MVPIDGNCGFTCILRDLILLGLVGDWRDRVIERDQGEHETPRKTSLA